MSALPDTGVKNGSLEFTLERALSYCQVKTLVWLLATQATLGLGFDSCWIGSQRAPGRKTVWTVTFAIYGDDRYAEFRNNS